MQTPNTLFITGNSSGLGRGLSQAFLERDWQVYGCSRRGYGERPEGLHDQRCDLTRFDSVPEQLDRLMADVDHIDLAILNAGILGEIKEMHKTPLAEIKRVMDINTWSNKVVLDWLHDQGRSVGQIILISSGAAVLGNKGWNAYALSKAALNMLTKLYAHELPLTHLCAIAPGLIDSPMMDYLCVEPSTDTFPALRRLRDARGTEVMPGPREAAERILAAWPYFKDYPSGSFIDIREILAPEEYQAMMAGREGG